MRSILLFTVCLLGAASAALAQDDVLTPHKLAELRAVTSAKISPDGQWVAYTVAIPRNPLTEDDGSSRSQLHVVNRESGESRPFVTSEDGVGGVTWTHDSRALVFTSKRGDDENSSLYRLPIDGGEARKVLELEDRSIRTFRIAPDGRTVAMLSTDPDSDDRKKEKKQGFKQEIYEEDLPFSRVWVGEMSLGGEATADPRRLSFEGHAYDIRWSPNGDRLAVHKAPTPLVDDQYMQQRVFIVSPENGSIIAKIDNPGKLGPASWSPDGKQLAIVAGSELHDGSAARLLIANTENGRFRALLPGFEGDFAEAHWHSTGLVLLGSKGVWSTLARMEGGQGQPELLLPQEGPIIHSFSMSDDGQQFAFVADTPNHPNEVYTASVPGGSMRRLTNSNPWLDGIRLAKQEVVTYKARDGLDIEGLLVRPLDEVEGQTYPVILCVHGGPESHYSNGWLTAYSRPGQVGAAQGFATFYQNYRGSTGRGLEFLKSSQGDPAGKEFDDVVDGIDALVEMGLADPKKIGVTGGSYGGYATAWCSSYYSDRIAAGVMFVGISNKISKVGTTDIPNEEYCVHALHRPWEDWDFFLKRSPIYYAGQCKTPLLILHGKDDPRVDPGQSREMYRHVKLRTETPVRLVHYPGEGHGNRKAGARLDYNLRMMRWFQHFLQEGGTKIPEYALDHSDPSEAQTETTGGTP